MLAEENYREWGTLEENVSLEDNFFAITNPMHERAFYLMNELEMFSGLYSVFVLLPAFFYAGLRPSFNSVGVLIAVALPVWFCFKLRLIVQKIYLTGGPWCHDESSDDEFSDDEF